MTIEQALEYLETRVTIEKIAGNEVTSLAMQTLLDAYTEKQTKENTMQFWIQDNKDRMAFIDILKSNGYNCKIESEAQIPYRVFVTVETKSENEAVS